MGHEMRIAVGLDVPEALRTNLLTFRCGMETDGQVCGQAMELQPHDWYGCPTHEQSRFRASGLVVDVGTMTIDGR